jgi:hypothetical protein
MNGLHFGIAGYAGTGAADTSNFDAVDVAVFSCGILTLSKRYILL